MFQVGDIVIQGGEFEYTICEVIGNRVRITHKGNYYPGDYPASLFTKVIKDVVKEWNIFLKQLLESGTSLSNSQVAKLKRIFSDAEFERLYLSA